MKKSELRDAVEKIAPAIKSEGMVFLTEKKLMAFDDEIAVSIPSPLKGITGAIPAEPLRKFLAKSVEDDLEVTQDERGVVFAGKRSKAGIRIQTEIEAPVETLGKPKEWHELPADFMEGIQACIFSAGKDMAKAVLTCLHVNGKHIESTDDNRLTRFTLRKGEVEEMLLPVGAAVALTQTEEMPQQIGKTDGWYHLKTESGLIFSCRQMAEKYPDLSGFLEVEGITFQFPEGLGSMLERAGVFAVTEFNQDERVTVSVKDGRLRVKSANESGFYVEKVKVSEYKGGAFSFQIHPDFLRQILNRTREAVIGENRLRMSSKRFIHVVALTAPEAVED